MPLDGNRPQSDDDQFSKSNRLARARGFTCNRFDAILADGSEGGLMAGHSPEHERPASTSAGATPAARSGHRIGRAGEVAGWADLPDFSIEAGVRGKVGRCRPGLATLQNRRRPCIMRTRFIHPSALKDI
ncbi:MAG TPA: hypothetical protein PLR28_02315 [Dokdonella sp.]|uniref:hypothetical protein n=1 Tax=Dokdonella sp. TaxID=2291710 RepID=UPI002D0A2F5B|nr:hypothetical protein [Dokdonella sp.]HOX70945.1 hypothetical protein [Dokdonella sp.]HPG93371.1 hypothetical protein [Dokdonella sp.]HPN80217.1 hypothetical protein [Dokdonella sp.]